MPKNLISRKEYRGINTFLLHAMMYENPFWLTFNQAKQLGGHVKQSEKACPVVFWKWLDVDDSESTTGKKRVPFLRYYSVFNLAQCEGIPIDKLPVLDGGEEEEATAQRELALLLQLPPQAAWVGQCGEGLVRLQLNYLLQGPLEEEMRDC